MDTLLQVIIIALATAAISTTTSMGSIFEPMRVFVEKRSKWLGKLARCPYCTGHWVAIIFTAIYQPLLIQKYVVADFIVTVFVIVALASLVSGAIMKVIPFHSAEAEASDTADERVEQLFTALETARAKIIEQQRIIQKLAPSGRGGSNAPDTGTPSV